MKWSLLVLVSCYGTCFALTLLPVPEMVQEKCFGREEYKNIQTDRGSCASTVFNDKHFNSRAIEEYRKKGTLPKLLEFYYETAQKLYKCQEPIHNLGRKCLPKEQSVFVNRTNDLYKQIMDYVFGNSSQRTIDFIEGGGYDCLLELDITQCQKIHTDTTKDVMARTCSNLDEMKICSVNFIQEKCPNVTSYLPDIIDMFTSAFCTAPGAIRSKRDIPFSTIREASKYYFLYIIPQGRGRIIRDLGGMQSKLPHIEQTLKAQCERDIGKLEPSIDSMKTCLDAKEIFVTPRDEYIHQIDHCSNETRRILKECLPEKYRYFPDLLFKVVESVVRFVYDDSGEIINGLAPCLSKLKSYESQADYLNCISIVNNKFDDKFPESKQEFCKEFIDVSRCFVTQVKDTCTTNPHLEKFNKDYMEAIEKPCKTS